MNQSQAINLQVNAQWDSQTGIPVPVNQFAILQGAANGENSSSFYEMHLGYLAAPMINPESPEFQQLQAAVIDLPVHRVGHMQVSIDLIKQMHDILGGVISAYDAQTQGG